MFSKYSRLQPQGLVRRICSFALAKLWNARGNQEFWLRRNVPVCQETFSLRSSLQNVYDIVWEDLHSSRECREKFTLCVCRHAGVRDDQRQSVYCIPYTADFIWNEEGQLWKRGVSRNARKGCGFLRVTEKSYTHSCISYCSRIWHSSPHVGKPHLKKHIGTSGGKYDRAFGSKFYIPDFVWLKEDVDER